MMMKAAQLVRLLVLVEQFCLLLKLHSLLLLHWKFEEYPELPRNNTLSFSLQEVFYNDIRLNSIAQQMVIGEQPIVYGQPMQVAYAQPPEYTQQTQVTQVV